MSVYNYGVLLNSTPTGFGTYTGMAITNSGNFPVGYTVSISDTTFDASVNTSVAANGLVYNTLFLSDNADIFDTAVQSHQQTIKVSDSGVFYIFHRPFYTFASGQATGIETATITINSISSAGDADSAISVLVTGQRATGYSIPESLGNFYAIKGGDNLEFHWQSITASNYFTGFRLQLSTNTSFSSLVSIPDYSVNTLNGANTENYLPVFGNYSGFLGEEYELTVAGLSYGQDYYARVCAINVTGGTGAFIYCTGYNSSNFEYDGTTYSGLHPSPGANLRYDATGLYLNYYSDYEQDFDLYSFIKKRNNNSDNFLRYSGVNVKLFPKTDRNEYAFYQASSTARGALNFEPPSAFSYSTGVGGIFRLEVETENIRLYGYHGSNATSATESPGNGGPIVKFANYNYLGAPVQYYMYKDVDSLYYAGAAGAKWNTVSEGGQTITVNVPGGTKSILIPPDLAATT
jgi:hypothetical protein